MARILSSILAFLGIAGCDSAAPDAPLSIKDLIESQQDAPLGETINDVSRALACCDVLLPTEGVHEQGQPLRIKTATDNEGREWAYAYTDEAELLAAFPDGSPFVQLRFPDAFGIVARDSKFGGIFLNRTEKYSYLIPREVFDTVQTELDAAPDSQLPTLD
jgi:type III secretion system (T3SS) SseB-like protein